MSFMPIKKKKLAQSDPSMKIEEFQSTNQGLTGTQAPKLGTEKKEDEQVKMLQKQLEIYIYLIYIDIGKKRF